MLQPARQRIAAERVDNVELLHADAQAYAFETESFDVVISRFGMMFFEDPRPRSPTWRGRFGRADG